MQLDVCDYSTKGEHIFDGDVNSFDIRFGLLHQLMQNDYIAVTKS